MKRRCGTCRWWYPDGTRSRCNAPMADWPESYSAVAGYVYERDGADCAVWAPVVGERIEGKPCSECPGDGCEACDWTGTVLVVRGGRLRAARPVRVAKSPAVASSGDAGAEVAGSAEKGER